MEGASDFKLVWLQERGPHQNEENQEVVGPSDFRISQDLEEGPHQNEEIRIW